MDVRAELDGLFTMDERDVVHPLEDRIVTECGRVGRMADRAHAADSYAGQTSAETAEAVDPGNPHLVRGLKALVQAGPTQSHTVDAHAELVDDVGAEGVDVTHHRVLIAGIG